MSCKQIKAFRSNGHVSASGSSNLPHSTFSLSVEQGQRNLHECCFGDSSLQLAQALTAAVKTSFDARSAVSIAQVFANRERSAQADKPTRPLHVQCIAAVHYLSLLCSQLSPLLSCTICVINTLVKVSDVLQCRPMLWLATALLHNCTVS